MYKLSKYNYVIPYNDRMIYFNGISLQTFSVSLKEHEKLQSLFQDLISFEINYTSVFEYSDKKSTGPRRARCRQLLKFCQIRSTAWEEIVSSLRISRK